MRPALLLLSIAAILPAGEPSPVPTGERVEVIDGRTVIHPYPIAPAFLNVLPEADERAYQDRIQRALEAYRGAFKGNPATRYGNSYFENEKQSYPNAFIDFVNGERETLQFLQADDVDGYNRITLMVDWFPCFTIRSQTRKYFWMGQYLTPEYRAKMFESARIWTEKDPLRRPHPAFVPPKPGEKPVENWSPTGKNSWVDVRNTDNLRAMRDGAVYLMAEETGNAEVAATYKERIRAYATACFSTGMGEWDSANYLAHTIVGYLQIYDFAKDPEVKALAKGVLDYLSTVAATAYFKGAVVAPNARDYNNVGPKEGFAGEAWLWFGDNDEAKESRPYRDFIHMATSAYRPPAAVLALARKEFAKPVEILQAKPTYAGWFEKSGGEDRVEYPVFLHVGRTYQIGTLPFLHRGDVNGFRLGWQESHRGVATLIAFSGTKGYKGHATATNGKDQVAQHRDAILWMNKEPGADLHLSVPLSATVSQQSGWTFVQGERTWLAIRPIAANGGATDAAAVESLWARKDKKTGQVTGSRYPDDTILSWTGDGSGPCGLYMELGEAPDHASFAAFQAAVTGTAKVDASGLAKGRVAATGSRGQQVGLTLTEQGWPVVERGGAVHDWARHQALYQTGSTGSSPVTLGWKQGQLKVVAGGRTFVGTLKDGRYTWENR
ncbi:MAG: hypothetical protein RLZZ127_2436 [Planctomycetota bacterium]